MFVFSPFTETPKFRLDSCFQKNPWTEHLCGEWICASWLCIGTLTTATAISAYLLQWDGMGLYSICICLGNCLHMITDFKATNNEMEAACRFVWGLHSCGAMCITQDFIFPAVHLLSFQQWRFKSSKCISKLVNTGWSSFLHDFHKPRMPPFKPLDFDVSPLKNYVFFFFTKCIPP